jgi:hypothetical protein
MDKSKIGIHMKIYFVTNQKWYSRLMRWLWNDEVTHLGIGFDEFNHELIFDISKPTGSVYPYEYWFNKYEPRYFIEIALSDEEIDEYFAELWFYCVLKPYDMNSYYLAIFWGIMTKFFKIKVPDINVVADEEKGFCSNVIEPLKELLTKNGMYLKNVDTYSKTPQMLLNIFKRYPYVKGGR